MSVSGALRATFSTTGNIKCSSLSARDITASSNAPYEQKENECSHHWLEDVQTTPGPSIKFMQDDPLLIPLVYTVSQEWCSKNLALAKKNAPPPIHQISIRMNIIKG